MKAENVSAIAREKNRLMLLGIYINIITSFCPKLIKPSARAGSTQYST